MITKIHSFLVAPGKGASNQPVISGAEVKDRQGQLFELIQGSFENAPKECEIDIIFTGNGKQKNPLRDFLLAYIAKPTNANGRNIAKKLQEATTNRSGLGLLFLVIGQYQGDKALLISRFPADSGILADPKGNSLSVDFLERVFMKSAKSYKSAFYHKGSFWQGKAIDKQINSRETDVSAYWVFEFLQSEFVTTSASGTKRLAKVLKSASTTAKDISDKNEIASVVSLAKNLNGKNTSIEKFMGRYQMSDSVKALVRSQLKSKKVREEMFRFDSSEFQKQIAYKVVELDSGAIMTAEAENFSKIFPSQPVAGKKGAVRYTAEGVEVAVRVKKTK